MWFSEFNKITPTPQHCRWQPQHYVFEDTVRVAIVGCDQSFEAFLWEWILEDLRRLLQRDVVLEADADKAALVLVLEPGETLPADGYSLRCNERGIRLRSESPAGLFYGVQTLSQMVAMNRREGVVRCGEILDWPHYARRCLMLDLGRATFSYEFLQRLIRLAARWKYNVLHLHLMDNEFNAVRFADSPLGSENPFALTLDQYESLIEYGRRHFVEIVPEIESWGHAGSLLQHYPHLYGATRMHGRGHSFGIGKETFDLLEQLYDQWISILPEGSTFHVGLDEANWRLLPGADSREYNKKNLARQLHELVQGRASAHGKRIHTAMWLDWKYDFEFIPADIRDDIVAMPWHYHSAEKIHSQLARLTLRPAKQYSKEGKLRLPFIGGGGASGVHELGATLPAQLWALGGKDLPNCLGVIVMVWATNAIEERLVTLYHGADSVWNPVRAAEVLPGKVFPEDEWGELITQMRLWQGAFPEFSPDALRASRGEEILHGLYRWGDKAGEEVLPLWMPEKPFLGDEPEVITPPAVTSQEEESHRADEV